MSFHVCFCLPVVAPVIIKTPKLWPTCKWLDCRSVNAWRWWTRPAGHQELLGIITQLSGPEVLVIWAFHGGYAGCWLLNARFLVAKIDGKAHMNSGKSDFCRSYIWFSPHFRVIPNQLVLLLWFNRLNPVRCTDSMVYPRFTSIFMAKKHPAISTILGSDGKHM